MEHEESKASQCMRQMRDLMSAISDLNEAERVEFEEQFGQFTIASDLEANDSDRETKSCLTQLIELLDNLSRLSVADKDEFEDAYSKYTKTIGQIAAAKNLQCVLK